MKEEYGGEMECEDVCTQKKGFRHEGCDVDRYRR